MLTRRTKFWLWTAAGTVALIVVSTVALAALWLAGWPNNHLTRPTLTRGVIEDSDWNNWRRGSAKLSAALNKRFPRGTPVPIMISELKAEGFESVPYVVCNARAFPGGAKAVGCFRKLPPPNEAIVARSGTLAYRWGGIPCVSSIVIQWEGYDSHRLTGINALYGAACL